MRVQARRLGEKEILVIYSFLDRSQQMMTHVLELAGTESHF